MSRILFSVILGVLPLLSFSQDEALWMRYPAISPDGKNIAFTYKGDIWLVSSTGGNAIVLTSHEAHDFMPVWSHDGKTIAFASNRYGNFDIFAMSAEGGEPVRLTYNSANEYPYSFTADDRSVIFGGARKDGTGSRQYPAEYQPQAYTVPAKGGRVALLWQTAAENIAVNKNGNLFIYNDIKGGENQWRKHHLSSVARDVILFDKSTGRHTILTTFKGEDRNPVFSADENSIYYLSEAGGSFNIHSLMPADPTKNRQLTFFKGNPVRFLSTSANGILCFGFDGSVYTMKNGEPALKVNIEIHSSARSNNDKIVPVSGNAGEMAVSPNGKEIAFIVRGEVFVTSSDGSITRMITNTPEEERFVTFSPTGDTIIYSSQRGDKWKIFMATRQRKEEPYFYASTLIQEKPLISNGHDCYQPLMSPDGREIAYIEDRNSLRIYNLASKKTRVLLTPDNMPYQSDRDQYFRWSPDSKWILAKYFPEISNPEIALIKADGSEKFINLTRSGYSDEHAEWVNGGKEMIWFSDRDGLRSYAKSGDRQTDVYALFFEKNAWDRFRMSKEDYALMKEIEEKSKEKVKKEAIKAKTDSKKKIQEVRKDTLLLTMDMDDISDRKARLTIHSSSLSDALLSKDGEKLYYLASFEKGLNLWSTNLRTKDTKMELALDADRANMTWDKEMKNIFLLADGKIYKINPEGWKKESVPFRSEMRVDIVREREKEFEYVWLKTKATFYTSTFHGADWDSLYTIYRKFLPHIGNGYEFAELLSEMLGELNVSHSGARFTGSDQSGDNTASLGILADYSYDGNGIKIKEILRGGPLDKASFAVTPGMIIEAIDGDTIKGERDNAAYLNRKADRFTLLSVYDPSAGKHHDITVKPVSMSSMNDMLYKRWVRKNQEEVDSSGNGRLGYVHIPGMSDGPYRSVYEEMMGKYSGSEGVIVDTRFNNGGDLVSDLTTFFTGKKYFEYATDKRAVGYEPYFRWTRPTVAMFNEANYSDGDCFACGYKELGIGKTIGMPVPGTCSWANWEMLQDGIVRWGVIPISTRDINGNWMENVETVPDYQIRNEPEMMQKGRDQQLEKAVEVLINEIKK